MRMSYPAVLWPAATRSQLPFIPVSKPVRFALWTRRDKATPVRSIFMSLKMSFVPFSLVEKRVLLGVKGVGPKVIERLEQMGFSTLHQVADADARDILAQGAMLSGSSCWKNSPQAKTAVEAAIRAALIAIDDNTGRI